MPSGPFNWSNNYFSSRIRKLDQNLNELWVSDFDDTEENDHFVIRSVSLDENNNVLGGGVAQNITTCSSYTDASDWVSTLINGASGAIIWIDSCINPTSTTFTFTYDIPSWINDVQTTSDGGYIAIGKYDDLSNNIVRKYASYLSTPQNILDSGIENSSIFPNPASSYFQLFSQNEIGSRFKITNLLGKVIYTGEIMQHEEIFDVSHLMSGTYYLIFENPNSKVLTLVKE